MLVRSRMNPYSAAYTIGIFVTLHEKLMRQAEAARGIGLFGFHIWQKMPIIFAGSSTETFTLTRNSFCFLTGKGVALCYNLVGWIKR